METHTQHSNTPVIIFDTETTGLDYRTEKIIEIGAVELIGSKITRKYHQFINPMKEISTAAYKVHGISNEMVDDMPIFSMIAKDFLNFIGDSTLVAHNASFDMGFINNELFKSGFKRIHKDKVVDTLQIARKKFPGSPASLDALCKRFKISLQSREKHGALIDSELLALVYLHLTEPDIEQKALSFHIEDTTIAELGNIQDSPIIELSETQKALHKSFCLQEGFKYWGYQKTKDEEL